jgi:hypothetical protein
VQHTIDLLYAGRHGNQECLPFLYPNTSKAYCSYKDAEGNVMKASFIIKLPGCYLFCYCVRERFHRLSPTLFHVSVNRRLRSFVDISLKSALYQHNASCNMFIAMSAAQRVFIGIRVFVTFNSVTFEIFIIRSRRRSSQSAVHPVSYWGSQRIWRNNIS